MAFVSDQIINMVKLHSSKINESYGSVKYARLKEYDPEHCIAKVAWYDPNEDNYEKLISGWLPIIVPFIGKGDDTQADGGEAWGFVAPPNIGQPVVVLSQHGDFNNGLIIGGSYSSKSPVPKVDGKATEDGEFLIMHKKGSYIKLWNDGDISIFTKHDLNLHIDHNGNVHILGDLNAAIDGQVAVAGGKSVLISAKSQIALDAPVVNVSKTLTVGNGATGQFETNGTVVTVENGIVTNII
jgi:phage baseplate assembly protein gpV